MCCVGCVSCVLFMMFFFFKQKTAYEMRISDWSSDVCSSDLEGEFGVYPEACERTHGHDHTLGHTCGPGRINLDERRISADSSGRMVGAAGRDQVMEAKVPRLGASGAEYPPRSVDRRARPKLKLATL